MSAEPPVRGATRDPHAASYSPDPLEQYGGAAWASARPSSTAGASVGFSSVGARLAERLRTGENRTPPPGQLGVLMAALLVGLLLMGTQLWLLTVALDLYLAGQGRQLWLLALVSGAIFVGGVVMLTVLGRRPRVSR